MSKVREEASPERAASVTPGAFDELVERILAETDYPKNPFLVALADGSFDRDDFVETQIQFYNAVIFFSRPMAAVAAKIPSARQRREILRNVWEEHGEGSDHDAHGETFLALLERLGVSEEELGRRPLWPEVRLFNTALTGACVMDEFLVGTGVLGMIERMFSDISGRIGRAIVAQGWLPADRIIHYDLHEELDIKHADDFFEVLRPFWRDGTDEDRYVIEQGLRLGAVTFDTLYEHLYRARTRRWVLDQPLERHLRA